jgi:hypothetical protein
MPVIRGVAHTTLEGAKALIELGDLFFPPATRPRPLLH